MKFSSALIVAALICVPVFAYAQIAPPAPGVDMPQAYYDRIADDPEAFQFKNAWLGKHKRVKQAQAQIENLVESGLSLSSVPSELRREAVMAGTVRVPVVMINYSNVGPSVTTTAMNNQLFAANPNGTMTELYTEMSYGNVTLTGDVLGWVAGGFTDAFYEGGCSGLCGAAGTGTLIQEAITGVDGGTDFGIYDNDGPDGIANSGDDDGFVDFIAIVHPEIGGECGGGSMWSHRWVVQGWAAIPGPIATNDPRTGGGVIRVQDYTIQPALGSVTGCGGGINEIGVFAHEFGHAFGLPDLYDTDGGGQGIGEHGLMGSGNWQNPPNPQHMGPWSKVDLGWLTATEVGPTTQTYNIANAHTTPTVFQLNIMEEKFNRKSLDPIAGSFSMHCGLPGVAVNARNWAGGKGYGNGWDEAVRKTFSYDGATHPVELEFDANWDTEPTFDFAKVLVDVNGTVTQVWSRDGIGSATDEVVDLTSQLMGSGASGYEVIFQFTSDFRASDEDGQYNSALAPFRFDNVSLTGGGENYFNDFETDEDGFCYDFVKNPNKEFFYVENRNTSGAQFGQNVHGEGLHIWHIELNVANTFFGNTSGSTTTVNLKPAGVQLVTADGLNGLLLNMNRGDAGDIFPGTTNNTTFDNTSSPNTRSHNNFATNVAVTNISAPAATMTADMRAGNFAPTVTSITPNTADNQQVVAITSLVGTWFYKGGSLCLRDGVTDYPATTTWHAKVRASASLDLNGVPGGTYDVVWKGTDGQEAVLVDGFVVNDVATGIGGGPARFANRLEQNVPNPFNPTTTIRYEIQSAAQVQLNVYNPAGQLVRTLVNQQQVPQTGGFSVVWDGTNDRGARVASGVYLYKLTVGSQFQDVRKLVLLK